MALQHLRSSTADKRPTPGAMSDGQLALNTNLVSPGLFFKDSNGDSVKIGPIHVGATAPNATPGAGGQAGNSKGEAWLDTSATNPILKVFNGSAFVAVQPVGTGTVVSTTDTGSVTSTMILDGTIVNADVNASAAIAGTKISPDFGAQNVVTTGTSTAASLIPTSSSVPTNGVYLPAANTVGVATSSSERARIDSSGRLLIGTSSAVNVGGYGSSDVQAYFQHSGGAASIAVISTGNNSNASTLNLSKSRGGTSTIVNNGDDLGAIRFSGADGTDIETRAAEIVCVVDGTPGANDMPGRIALSTTADGASSPTERMRIDSSGNVGINRTPAADARLDVNGLTRLGTTVTPYSTAIGAIASANGTTNTGNVALETVSVSSATRFHISFSNPNGVVGSISTSGSATAYNTSSDYRLKENVVDLDGAISRLKLLPVHRFNFIADPDKTVDGFIAHEAAEVVPEAVTGAKDEVDDEGNPVYQGIDQSKLVPLLTAALQEAVAKIESLEARLTAAGI